MKDKLEIGDLVLYPHDNTLGFVVAIGGETPDGKDFSSPQVRWIDNNTIYIMFGNEIDIVSKGYVKKNHTRSMKNGNWYISSDRYVLQHDKTSNSCR